jgi:hypothetical protein
VWADNGRPTAALALSGFSFCIDELARYCNLLGLGLALIVVGDQGMIGAIRCV